MGTPPNPVCFVDAAMGSERGGGQNRSEAEIARGNARATVARAFCPEPLISLESADRTVLGGPPAMRRSLCLPSARPCLLVLLGFLLCSIAPAETPASLKTLPPKEPIPTRNPAESATPKEPEPTNATPSRFVAEENLASHVASISERFSMRGRATDPFGQFQDPDAKPIIKATVAKTSHRAAPVLATPFSDIIRLIKVTTVMPKEKRFLVGTRAIQQGDCIPLNYHGKTLRVEVAAVTSHQIEFRNLDNNETAALKLDLLPAGMTPGSRLLSAPGMTPDRPDSPIELESASLPNDKSPNR